MITRITILVLVVLLISGSTSSITKIENNKITFNEKNVDKMVPELPNIILLIGDGMGPEQIKAASLVEYGKEFASVMDTNFTSEYLFSTDSLSFPSTTDSAASGTALATGFLTKNRIISMDENKEIYFKTILEYLQFDFGYSTGLVTQMVSTHATPAVFVAHTGSRDEVSEILPQMLSKNIDVILGAGLDGPFLGPDITQAQLLGENYNYQVAVNKLELKVKSTSADRLLGIFPGAEGDHIGYELERDIITTPSLLEMSEAALNLLRAKSNPYFVMIEGGLIDYAGHFNEAIFSNKTLYNILETIAFEKSVRYALEVAKNDGNTIVIVAGDHETGGLTVLDFSNLDDVLPNSNNSRETNMQIRFNRVEQLSTNWLWNAHTDTKVKFFGYGSSKLNDFEVKTNKDVFWAIDNVVGSFPAIYYKGMVVGNNLLIDTTIKDLDNSTENFTVVVEYNNDTTKEFTYNLNYTEGDLHSVEVPIDPNLGYKYYIRVNDNGINDVLSFNNLNQLVKQNVIHPVPTVSSTSSQTTTSSDKPTSLQTTQSETSEITSTSDEADSIGFMFYPPLIIGIIVYKIKRTRRH